MQATKKPIEVVRAGGGNIDTNFHFPAFSQESGSAAFAGEALGSRVS